MEQLAAIITYLGIYPPDLFAGFCGSIVNIAGSGTKPGKVLLTMVANALLANYFGAAIGIYLGTTTGHVGAFFVGWIGPSVIRRVIEQKVPGFFGDQNKEEPSNGKS